MSWIRLSPIPSADLTTLAHVQTQLPDGHACDPAELATWIRQASDMLTTYCGCEFAEAMIEETLEDQGGRFQLIHRPVGALHRVFHDGLLLTDYEIADAEAGRVHAPRGRSSGGWRSLGREDVPMVVLYTGGYVLPGWNVSRTLPQPIEQACVDTVLAWVRGEPQTIPPAARLLIAPWRREQHTVPPVGA